MTTNISVMRQDAPNPADVPPDGWAGAIVTLIAGKITGEIVCSIFDGGTLEHEAHVAIDGHRRPLADVAIQTDDAQVLRDLSVAPGFLADELGGGA